MTDRATTYLDLFNSAVLSGDWARWAAVLTDDVVMTFVGVSAGPYAGRATVLDAYRSQPPDDTIVPLRLANVADVDVIDFTWARGGRGVLRLSWRADQLSGVVVEFR